MIHNNLFKQIPMNSRATISSNILFCKISEETAMLVEVICKSTSQQKDNGADFGSFEIILMV